jgi:hypothetical protein
LRRLARVGRFRAAAFFDCRDFFFFFFFMPIS